MTTALIVEHFPAPLFAAKVCDDVRVVVTSGPVTLVWTRAGVEQERRPPLFSHKTSDRWTEDDVTTCVDALMEAFALTSVRYDPHFLDVVVRHGHMSRIVAAFPGRSVRFVEDFVFVGHLGYLWTWSGIDDADVTRCIEQFKIALA